LAPRSSSQARLEYRLATEQTLELAVVVAAEAPALVDGFYSAKELVAGGRPGEAMLDSLIQSLATRLPATCVRLDEELAFRAPTNPGPWLRRANNAVEDLHPGNTSPWCEGAEREPCIQLALKSADRAKVLAPTMCAPYVQRARALIFAGDEGKGLMELSEASNFVNDRLECLQAVVTLANEAHDERTPRERGAARGIVRPARRSRGGLRSASSPASGGAAMAQSR
jgi:hypothetical protein